MDIKYKCIMAKSKNPPRGLRNNNPGNIRQSSTRYVGEVYPSQDDAFKQFESIAYGYRAMFVLLNSYQRKYGLNTIAAMISRYAPSVENATDAYIQAVADWSGVPPTGRITTTNGDIMVPIVAAMSRVENGVFANMPDVIKGWDLFIDDYRKHNI